MNDTEIEVLANAIGRELDPRAFDRSRFYNDMEYGFYKSRHMFQIDKAVGSNAFREWLAEVKREAAAQERSDWADWVGSTSGQVPGISVEQVASALRSDRRPFGHSGRIPGTRR